MTEISPRTIHDGGRYFEGPRWHAGKLWFVDCMARTLLSLGTSGECQQHAKFDDDTPCDLGVLKDGTIIVLTMFRKRLLAWRDGELSLYADLSGIATGTIDDMIVDGLGRAWVGDLGFDLPPPKGRGAVGRIILVMPDGATRIVADGLRFPNGIAVSADNDRLVVAEMDGACLADYDIAADGGLTLRGRFGRMKSPQWYLPRSRRRRVGRGLRGRCVHPARPRRARIATHRSPRPPRAGLRARRRAAAHALLLERRNVVRGVAATQVVVSD